jgi:pimeloyl-ACP methyl ester carboxylesterase
MMACTQIFAQPDLICSNVSNTQTSLDWGQRISLSFRIKNIGSSTAGVSHAGISLIDTSTLTTTFLADVSTESLASDSESGNYYFILPLSYAVPTGSMKILVQANDRGEVSESNTSNNYTYSQNSITILNGYKADQNLPYPVILIHGLCGNDTTWYPYLRDLQGYFGYSYGGNLNFCLNEDNDVNTSYLPTDFKDWTDTTQLVAGDFYTINFDVDPFGNKYSSSTQSNQSAAVKQGVAVQKAIAHVLKITGRDKVVLVGHSMGGLAAREYLQNKGNWQPDGQHHVAKLFTTGTPHGGSNSTSGNLTSIFQDVDERSEAVRDLRRTYDVSGDSGVYLYGGLESLSVMDNSLFEDYFNADVNCNGVIGDNIVGLNYKSIPTDLSYTCVIGYDTYFPGLCSNCDGVVNFTDADLNNFLPQVNADTFFCVGEGSPLLLGGKPWHVQLPKQTYYNEIGLDEPDNKTLAYRVQLGKHYYGHITPKNAASLTSVDSDYYKFTITTTGNLSVFLYNIPTSQATLKITDSATNTSVLLSHSNGKGYLGKIINSLNPGTYYLNIYSKADLYSWENPYCFELTFADSALPIIYTSVEANEVNNSSARINWQTATEINTTNFIIQHSSDGISFTEIGNIPAIGKGANSYEFTDNKPNNGINYYRLKSFDKDGSSNYSKVVSVTIGDKQSFSIIPNPARDFATISFSQLVDKATIAVYDITGKAVITQSVSGTNAYKLNTQTLTNGVYVIKVNTTTGSYNEKLLINK